MVARSLNIPEMLVASSRLLIWRRNGYGSYFGYSKVWIHSQDWVKVDFCVRSCLRQHIINPYRRIHVTFSRGKMCKNSKALSTLPLVACRSRYYFDRSQVKTTGFCGFADRLLIGLGLRSFIKIWYLVNTAIVLTTRVKNPRASNPKRVRALDWRTSLFANWKESSATLIPMTWTLIIVYTLILYAFL